MYSVSIHNVFLSILATVVVEPCKSVSLLSTKKELS